MAFHVRRCTRLDSYASIITLRLHALTLEDLLDKASMALIALWGCQLQLPGCHRPSFPCFGA
jgi:hypothetical protein